MNTLLLIAALSCPLPIKEVNDGFWTTDDDIVLAGAKIQCSFRFPKNPCVKKITKIADKRHTVLCGPKTEGGL
jgi:hypothetical protein